MTFARDVAPILNQHCVECHRAGEIGPFALTDYDQAAGWGEIILEVIDQKRMPPWHANPQHGSFKNERLMSDAEKQTVYAWVARGAPQGDPKQLPEPIEYVSGSRLSRRPDAIAAIAWETIA